MGIKWTEKEEQYLIDNYQSSIVEILSKELNRTKAAIKSRIQKLGLKLEKESKQKRYEQRKQKYTVDADFFIYPQDELLVGYLMGFIWADGYVSKKDHCVSLYIKSEDMDDIKDLFLMSGEWQTYNKTPILGKKLTRLSCHCFKLHQFLTENNYKDKSQTSPNRLLEDKSISYKIGFWRGCLDGDGCYHFNPKTRKKSISISGSSTQDWSAYIKLLKELDCKFTIKITETNGSYVTTCDAKSVVKIISHIYNTKYDGIGLKRKHKKAIDMKKYISNLMIKNKHLY